MKINKIIYLAVSLVLASCAPSVREQEEANNFRPYIFNQQESIPGAYPNMSWSYPAGTRTQEIVNRWRLAGLVERVATYPKNGATHVTIGPQFYNLSQSSQRGLADAVAQMYNARTYFLVDDITKKIVGYYTASGLQMY